LGIGSANFKFCDALAASASSIGFAYISFRFCKRRVAEHRHDFVRRGAVVGQATAESFPQAMRLAFNWQSSGSDRVPHELRKARCSEGPTKRGIDDSYVISRGMF
jgi:hypothetical protein